MPFLAAMLAWVAVIGMGVLSGWHGAAFHDHDLGETAAFAHVHTRGGDPDNAVHLAAHAVGHGVPIPAQDTPAPVIAASRQAWPTFACNAAPGADPSSPRRPPRA